MKEKRLIFCLVPTPRTSKRHFLILSEEWMLFGAGEQAVAILIEVFIRAAWK